MQDAKLELTPCGRVYATAALAQEHEAHCAMCKLQQKQVAEAKELPAPLLKRLRRLDMTIHLAVPVSMKGQRYKMYVEHLAELLELLDILWTNHYTTTREKDPEGWPTTIIQGWTEYRKKPLWTFQVYSLEECLRYFRRVNLSSKGGIRQVLWRRWRSGATTIISDPSGKHIPDIFPVLVQSTSARTRYTECMLAFRVQTLIATLQDHGRRYGNEHLRRSR